MPAGTCPQIPSPSTNHNEIKYGKANRNRKGIPVNKRTFLSSLAGLLMAVSLVPVDVAAQVVPTVTENFTGATTQNSWLAYNGACLTAGSQPGIANKVGNNTVNTFIPMCKGLSYYGSNTQVGLTSNADPVGSGALRLTNGGSQGTDENGAIISQTPFPTTQGIQITFTTYTYGGNSYGASDGTKPGADGIGFYLLNGTATTGNGTTTYNNVAWTQAGGIGAFGGSLGYSCSNSNNPHDGMPGAYMGLGIDEYGNFLDQGDNTHTGVNPNTSVKQNPNEIGLRGYGNVNLASLQAVNPQATEADVANTCKNGGTYTFGGTTYHFPDYAYISPSYKHLPNPISNESVTKRQNATPITYKLIITPNLLLSLSYDYGNTGTFAPVVTDQDIASTNGPLPSSFLFGFGGSTGGGTNVHEILCFEASPAARTISAPVAPVTVSSGSDIYTLSTNPDPLQGFVNAYALDASGHPATAPSWEAGAEMTASQRTTNLVSSNSSGTATPLLTLASTEPAAFALPVTPPSPNCVPNATTIANYTIDPTNTTAPSGCTPYLGTRQKGSFLDGFSSGDFATVLSPPSNVLDFNLTGYTAWARGEQSRPTALLFTNDDGFLYSVDAKTGQLNWGWMPRSFLSQLQNYTAWPYQDNFAGKFAAVDAIDASNNWATYIIGSAQNGALWYDLQLDSSGNPAKVINMPTMPSGAVYPQRQAPVEDNIGASQMAAFIVNTPNGSGGTVSTLYEFNVATGAFTNTVIPATTSGIGAGAYVTSNLYYDQSSGELFFGTSTGRVYVMSFTGTAATDVSNITSEGSTQDGLAVQYVGYSYVNSNPYLWAASQTGLTVFGYGMTGWQPLWATTTTSGYTASMNGSGNITWTASSTVTTLQSTAQITDMPFVTPPVPSNIGVLNVPATVPPSTEASSCGALGTAYQDYFNLVDGTFPKNFYKDYQGNYITTDTNIGSGTAYSSSISLSSTGVKLYGGSSANATPNQPITAPVPGINKPVQWRVQ